MVDLDIPENNKLAELFAKEKNVAANPPWLEKLQSRIANQSWGHMGMVLASIAFFVIALLCLIEGWIVLNEQKEQARVLSSRAEMADDINDLVERTHRSLQQSANQPEILLLLDPANTDATALTQAAQKFRAAIGQKDARVEVFRADLTEMFAGDLEQFGYARSNALTEAQASENGRSRVQVTGTQKRDPKLTFAVALRNNNNVQAFVLLNLSPKPIQDMLDKASQSGGRVRLQQGEAAYSSAEIFADSKNPSSQLAEMISFDLLPVPGTRFWIGAESVNQFKPSMVFDSLAGMSPTGLFSAGGFLAILSIAIRVFRLQKSRSQNKTEQHDENEEIMPAMYKAPLAAAADEERIKANIVDSGRAESGVVVDEGEGAPEQTAANQIKKSSKSSVPAVLEEIDRSIFRAYDIRGIVGKSLMPGTAHAIGQAVGSAAIDRGLNQIVVARDGRNSGPALSEALMQGIRASGCDVIDIGAVPTPTLYFATYQLGTGSGVMVTGSHNPADYNGFKIMLGGETLADSQIQDLFVRIVEGRMANGQGGIQSIDVRDDYVERITGDVQISRKLKVVVDAGNGIAGELGPKVLTQIGCEVVPLYCEVDGKFPNHHPDPSEPKNLADLIFAVKQYEADFGLAFDGDGDRLGVVTPKGEIIWPDRVLMLFAQDVLSRNPGASIIFDVKCTGRLNDEILRHGGMPIMWKTGHSLIKGKMREEDAALAGEMSGHFFFGERWYGFDDGIYAAARLCEILSHDMRDIDSIFAELPNGINTPELKVPMQEGAHYEFVERFRERAKFPGAGISLIDGVRADYVDGWGLVRCSNTTPCLVLRFEADNKPALDRIQNTFREQLFAIDANLNLPF